MIKKYLTKMCGQLLYSIALVVLEASCAFLKGKVIKKGFGNEWLVEFSCEKWWAKGYDIEVITQNQN